MAWFYLGIAILFEVAGTTCMKLSAGFTKLLPSLLMLFFYLVSLSFLTLSLKKLTVSVSYAIWSGIGTTLITLVGVMWFKETLSMVQIIGICFIIFGVVLLNLYGAH